MSKRGLSILALSGLVLVCTIAQAAPAIPEKTGWSGYVNLGVGAGTSKSNMVHGLASVDLGKERVSSLRSSPDSEDVVLPAIDFELAYTLGDSLTQFYLSSQVEDYLSFDADTTLKTHAGIRQTIAEVGTVDISLAMSSLPTDVWKDPYLVDSKRADTERTYRGIHLGWGGILGTEFKFLLSSGEIEVDDERSGDALGLSRSDQRLLRRTGNLNRLRLSYEWKIKPRHRLIPGIGYLDIDLNGEAMAVEGPTLQLQYLYERDRWSLVSEVFYRDLDADTRHPIYGKKQQVETWAGGVTAYYSNPFGLEHWTANASLAYSEGDSNINFYDSSLGLVSIGMLYRFE